MKYADIVRHFIKKSTLTLDEISEKIEARGLTATKQYLSKLQNGKTPPASDKMNKAIAEITGGDPEELIMAAYLEKAPEEIKEQLENFDGVNSSIDGIFQMMKKEAKQNPVFFESTRQLVVDFYQSIGMDNIEDKINDVDELFDFIDGNFGVAQKIQMIGGYFIILNSVPKKNKLPELNEKDEKDIAKKLENILDSMDSDTALAFDGEPMDEETRELVRAAIDSNLRLTKQLAKRKFTPKKYRKE